MNFIVIGDNIINVNCIVQIQKISTNNFKVFLSDQRVFPNLTLDEIKPILLMLGII
jgi:hypothetical protein